MPPTVAQGDDLVNPSAPSTVGPSPSNGNYASAVGYGPVSGNSNSYSPASVPPTNYATGPVADFGNQNWGWSPSSTTASPSATPASATSNFNPRALSEAVWGSSGYTPAPSTSSAPGDIFASTGNRMSDFLLDRGDFTPKKEDEDS